VEIVQGAEEVAGLEELSKALRTQMGKGADIIKIYADYRYGPNGEARPSFTEVEWQWIMMNAKNGGRKVAAHASTIEAMKLAAMAGVSTIEHGDEGNDDVFKLMKEKGVALCPTLAAGDAILQYNGWKKGMDPEPQRIINKKRSFQSALKNGVTIAFGGDVGVYTHGDNAREAILMVEYGMTPMAVLQSATSVNADVFGYNEKIGRIRKGLLADIIAVQGDPTKNINALRQIRFIMKDGTIYKTPLVEGR
jgi:imidazolonepropionase-like amidohydrolase